MPRQEALLHDTRCIQLVFDSYLAGAIVQTRHGLYTERGLFFKPLYKDLAGMAGLRKHSTTQDGLCMPFKYAVGGVNKLFLAPQRV